MATKLTIYRKVAVPVNGVEFVTEFIFVDPLVTFHANHMSAWKLFNEDETIVMLWLEDETDKFVGIGPRWSSASKTVR